MRYKGIIFDLDGTLADTLEDLADSMNRVLALQGLPVHSYDAYRYFIGKGVTNLVAETLPQEKRSEELIIQCYELIVADYWKNYLVKTRLYDGISDVLNILKGQGIKMAVFSNKPDGLTKKIVEALAGNDNFEMVIGAQAGLPVKPDPAGAMLISSHFGIAPGDILYLGDTDIDMMTANNARMVAVGAQWGFRTKEDLLGSGASAVIAHPLELLQIMGIEMPAHAYGKTPVICKS
ncbi:MAG TPA: HAD family hydrolase [Syntrophorhabdaceae bacterium]|nr:HAD family hydrolase [Syntrophorhabdaceae bacterium]HQM80288.1 HAD family hydrolase [Syntrophorhabdaceae bacterium]